jgi:hypothetical protein
VKTKHALYFAVAFIAIAIFLVGDGKDGPLARMQGNSSPDGSEYASAPKSSPDADQIASSDGYGFAYDSSDSEFDTELIEDLGFEYYGDEDLTAQADGDEGKALARNAGPPAPKYIIAPNNPPVVLNHSGARINRERNSTIERSPGER